MHLIARILNLKNRYQSVREFECTLIDLSGEKMKLSGKLQTQLYELHVDQYHGYAITLLVK